MQNVVYMSTERNWSLLFLLCRRRRFLIHFASSLCSFFYFFGNVSFAATTPDKFQFQSQLRLSQINVVVPIGLKFNLYAVFIKRGSRIKLLFLGRQDIVKYWTFPPRFRETVAKDWYRKLFDLISEKRL